MWVPSPLLQNTWALVSPISRLNMSFLCCLFSSLPLLPGTSRNDGILLVPCFAFLAKIVLFFLVALT